MLRFKRHLLNASEEALVHEHDFRVVLQGWVGLADSRSCGPCNGKLSRNKRGGIVADSHGNSFRGCFANATISRGWGSVKALPATVTA